MRVILFDVADRVRMSAALAIRQHVFMDEQGVPADEEIDVHDLSDAGAVHAVAYGGQGMKCIGTGRFYAAEPGCAQIGRMAVLAEHRGRRVGRALLDALIAEAVRRGFVRAQLLAQVHAIAFYERAGFAVVADAGEVWDAGILHRVMERVLP